MAISDIPILTMLRTRLSWHQQRQRVLAENVANADTAQYRARDLVAPKFDAGKMAAPMAGVRLALTESGHIAGPAQNDTAFASKVSEGYEVRPTGNAVSLEDEMMKVAANQMDFQAATAVYTHSLNLIKTAIGKR